MTTYIRNGATSFQNLYLFDCCRKLFECPKNNFYFAGQLTSQKEAFNPFVRFVFGLYAAIVAL